MSDDENILEPLDLTGWVETVDKKTGKRYYANKKTRETRWKPPRGWEEWIQNHPECIKSPRLRSPKRVVKQPDDDAPRDKSSPRSSPKKSPRSPKQSPRFVSSSPKRHFLPLQQDDEDLTEDAKMASANMNLMSELQLNYDQGMQPEDERYVDGDNPNLMGDNEYADEPVNEYDYQPDFNEPNIDMNIGFDDPEQLDADGGDLSYEHQDSSQPEIRVVPDGNIDKEAALASDQKPGYWKECEDPKSSRKYYYHTITRQRVWDKPEEYEELLEIFLEWKKNRKKNKVEKLVELPSINAEPLVEMGMQGPEIQNPATSFVAPSISNTWDVEVKESEDYEETVEEKQETSQWDNDDLEVIEVEKLSDVPRTQFGDYKMEKYAEKYFNQHKSGIFSKLSFLDMLHFTNEPIRAPMLKKLNASSVLSSEAVQVFRNITGYMGDRSTSKVPLGHIRKICKTAVEAPEEMRDEIYCQLIRQTNGNDKRDSYVKGWILMAMFCSIFPPSEELAAYLSAYIQQSIELSNEISPYALYAQQRLYVTLQTGARRAPPSPAEVDAIEQRKTIATRVRFLDDTFKTLAIEPQTTARTVCRVLGERLALNNSEAFALFELTDDVRGKHIKEILINPDERILDVMGRWEDSQKRNPDYTFRLVYRYHLIFEKEEEFLSDTALHMLFIQCVYDVITGNYPVSENVAMELSAIQTQAIYGGKDISIYSPGLLSQKLKEYVSRSLFEKRELSYLEGRILKEHSKYINFTKNEAKREYIKICKEITHYGCCYFRDCKQIMALSKEPPIHVYIGVSERGIFVFDTVTMSVKSRWLYPEIVGYGNKEKEGVFMAIVGNNVKKNKFQFVTAEGRAIKEMVATYINRAVDYARAEKAKQKAKR